MKLYVSVKQAGKRKDYISKKEINLKENPLSLRELISEIVNIKVDEYNKKSLEPSILEYLSGEETDNLARTGKVGFGERKSDMQVDAGKATTNAIISFEDGIYRVFINDNEVKSLDRPINIKEDDVLTFIRFTMLAGRMW